MKPTATTVATLAGLGAWLIWAQATPPFILTGAHAELARAVIAAARAELEPLAEKIIPRFAEPATCPPGTYWMVQADSPPYPFNPFPELEVFALGDDIYLVDDRCVDWAGLAALAAEAEALRQLESALGLASATAGVEPMAAGEGRGEAGEDLRLELLAVTHGTGFFRIHTPETNGVYDLFATTNLSPNVDGLNLTNWAWVLRTAPGQTNVTVTNLTAGEAYFQLGRTNDTDGGGFSDAFERLVTHTDPDNPADDRLVPLVGIQVVDSVAVEQQATNTARFMVWRLGGYVGQPLTVAGGLSGTATHASDYWLGQVTVAGTNVWIPLAAGQTRVEITLAAVNDAMPEGTETATLTLATNAAWVVDPAHRSATAWILETYGQTYTLDVDFQLGLLAGLEAFAGMDDGHLRFKANLPAQFPFLNVACSGRGTVARINTTNGQVLGEYRTTPAGLQYTGDSGQGPQPSRTTVDLFGNVWVANRADDRAAGGRTNGSITRIGLIVGGTRHSKSNGVYYPDPNGQYVSLSDALYNTCLDRDGDGFIRTSRGLADILPWTNQRDGRVDVDSDGGVSTAEDEAITEYVRVPSTGTRTLAVDKWNDIWVGGYRNEHYHLKVNGLTAEVVPGSVFSPTNQYGVPYGGYGGVMDRLGQLWSSESSGDTLLRLRPSTNWPPLPNTDWTLLTAPGVNMYGIAVDPLHPYVWQTTTEGYVGQVFRWHTNGTPVTNANGTVRLHRHGSSWAQGLVVDTNGHVWVAHGRGAIFTVGHLDTNGTWLGNVLLRLSGLRAEYFPNTNFGGTPALVRTEGPLDLNWGNGSPGTGIPSNYFSARWLGVLEARREGQHVLIVSADAGAAVRLSLDGLERGSSNWWTAPGPDPVELYITNYLFTNVAYHMKLEYIEFTGEARIRLSWIEPGTTTNALIPMERFQQLGQGPTGASVDAAGKIWVANYDSHNVMRIDPNEGPIVLVTNVVGGVTNVITNRLGWVDMVVNLGDGSFHPQPYNVPASPYNYSDMTGLNNRVVNPTLQPLKGYWTVIDDSGQEGRYWNKVSWSNSLPAGCSMEVYVRASDDRVGLANERFVAVSNNIPFTGVNGRYIEVRVALIRDDPAKQPVLYDLTLHGLSTSFLDWYLDDEVVEETQTAEFWPWVLGAEPLQYQWWALYPWTNDWLPLPGQTNSRLVLTNVDSWDHTNWFGVVVTSATGESMFVGPALLWVVPKAILIYSSGPASRYPATIEVFGLPTHGLSRVEVWLERLSHGRSEDLDILLMSPSGYKIILMSDAGGTNTVSNATMVFHGRSDYRAWGYPPEYDPIPSNQESHYWCRNYGEIENQLPGAPPGPYLVDLDLLQGTNPNGVWTLYLHDDRSGATGELRDSWRLKLFFE